MRQARAIARSSMEIRAEQGSVKPRRTKSRFANKPLSGRPASHPEFQRCSDEQITREPCRSSISAA
jgi:hypothetical protein